MLIKIPYKTIVEFDWPSVGFTLSNGLLRKDGTLVMEVLTTGKEATIVYDNREAVKSLLSPYEYFIYQKVGLEYFFMKYGVVPQPAMFDRLPSPKTWEEFLSVTEGKDEREKRRYYNKKTNTQRGLTKDELSGNLWPITYLQYYNVNGSTIKTCKESLLAAGYYDFFDLWYNCGLVEVGGQKYPSEYVRLYSHTCEECGLIHFEDSCPVCSKKYQVREYNFKAESILPFKDEGEKYPDYMGIELEYEDCKDQAKAVIKAFSEPHVVLKRDGSISHGFEIVTAPATLAVHKKAFSGFYEKVALTVKRNCGMHVHVDKRTMGEMQKGKLLAFLYNPYNKEFITAVAGREFSSNHYCKAIRKKDITYGLLGDEEAVSRTNDGKYEALNLSPPNTVEFRIFAPPTDETTLFARLEFVQALVDFTKPGIIGIKELTLQKFKDFVGSYKKIYPNFYKFMGAV